MLSMIRKAGISSGMLYTMGFGSIALSVVSWAVSKKVENAGTDRADRWGIFVGQWAPTFFAMGTAMRLDEQWGERAREEEFGEMKERSRTGMPVA